MGRPPRLSAGDGIAHEPLEREPEPSDHHHLHADEVAADAAASIGRRGALLRIGGLTVFIATAALVVVSSGALSAGRVRDWLDGYGAAGPFIFIVVSALLTVCIFPGPLLAGAAGLLFGTAVGFPTAVCAATLGASLAFALSRWVAHDAIDSVQGPRLRAIREWLGRRGFLSVLYARIIPGMPYNLVNYAAGLSPVRLRSFAAATALGVAPRAFAYVSLGGSWGDWTSPQSIMAIAIIVAMAVVGGYIANRDRRRSASAPGQRG